MTRRGKGPWLLPEASKACRERISPGCRSKFLETDPEFIGRFDHFAFGEVVSRDDLADRTRRMVILAALRQ